MILIIVNKEIGEEFDYINKLEYITTTLNFKIEKILKEIIINIILEKPLIKE